MRFRRMNHCFWACFILMCGSIFFMMMNVSLTNEKSRTEDELKWQQFETKLKKIETALNHHSKVVNDIKEVVDDRPESADKIVVEDKIEYNIPEVNINNVVPERKPAMCAFDMNNVPKTDIQMLKMYETMNFDDIDGGVWKQGYKITYKQNQWNATNKLRVFIVPHSHNDPGWLKTFEEYYNTKTKSIFRNIVDKLSEDTKRKFIWAEISFLRLWFKYDATDEDRKAMLKLIHSGQLEIVTGGWVMNDEANSHWLSIIHQMTVGQDWALHNLGVVPRSGWAIDPFGHSSTQPYILKLMGLENSLIQRVHYRVKKELAYYRNLEFHWRQSWDGVGKTDMFTHMMPFYSYDVPHTCGPDPKICCQFDFGRLQGSGLSCPWKVNPKPINSKNIDTRSAMIIDQWRKKSQLYRTNVVLIPLGDDFRWDTTAEWDNQLKNYDTLIEYINANPRYNVNVTYGTLSDYFNELRSHFNVATLPTLSGDFFTYADRNEHYWSGYYTSRPYYKHMERELLGYVRAAEYISTQAMAAGVLSGQTIERLMHSVKIAKRSLALFQHHDGITGTAKDKVVEDYASKMKDAIQECKSVIQSSVQRLLQNNKAAAQSDKIDDNLELSGTSLKPATIVLEPESPPTKIILYNPLPFTTTEVVNLYVTHHYVKLVDDTGAPIDTQISPVVLDGATITSTKYQLTFVATIPAMSHATYNLIAMEYKDDHYPHLRYAKVRVFNSELILQAKPPFDIQYENEARGVVDLNLNGSRVLTVSERGYLRSVETKTGPLPAHLDFVQYTSKTEPDNNSGAYLFIPNGPATPLKEGDELPALILIEGDIMSSIAAKHSMITQTYSAHKNPSKPQVEIKIENVVDIRMKRDLEVAMKISTNIHSDVYYTDLNGFQMIKRKTLPKLPIQANFYPMPAAAYVQDDSTRMTILTSTPLGVASLEPGEIEIIQDRRLSRDDNRGLNQGVLDNVETTNVFKLLFESKEKGCQEIHPEHPLGALTLAAHIDYETLIAPSLQLTYRTFEDQTIEEDNNTPKRHKKGLPADIVLANYRPSFLMTERLGFKTIQDPSSQGFGVSLHRRFLDRCYGDQNLQRFYPLSDGTVDLADLLDVPENSLFEANLLATKTKGSIPGSKFDLCPMEIFSVFIKQTMYS